MSTDLHERLANYRHPLDEAIEFDLANRPVADHRRHPSRSRILVGATAVAIIAAGIGALVWTDTNRSATPANTVVLEQPATSASDSVLPVLPEPTIAPAPVVPAPVDTSPPAGTPIDRLALGDSVMLGAAGQLVDAGFTVDAVENRTFHDGLDTILSLDAHDRLGEVVVVHLGANGSISNDDITTMMDALADVPQVLLLTNGLPRNWVAGNNSLLDGSAAAYPNVSLLDWGELGGACPGDCFYKDGYHLRPDGQAYYADLITAAVHD